MNELDRIRTDVVGSLLRPQVWKDARSRLEQQLLSITDFARIESDCVRRHVALQERIGLDVVTDGEIGRLNFQDSFGLSVTGYDTGREGLKQHEQRAAGGKPLERFDMPDLGGAGTPVVHRRPVSEKLKLARNIPLEEYRRAAPLARKPVKVSLIERLAMSTKASPRRSPVLRVMPAALSSRRICCIAPTWRCIGRRKRAGTV